jgi:hypothetical protein
MKLLFFIFLTLFLTIASAESLQNTTKTMCNSVKISVGYFSAISIDNYVDFSIKQIGSQLIQISTNDKESSAKMTIFINRGFRDFIFNLENDCSKKQDPTIDISSD